LVTRKVAKDGDLNTDSNGIGQRRSRHAWTRPLAILAGCLFLTGCQSLGIHVMARKTHVKRDPASGIQVERGRPSKIVDGLGTAFGIPTKLALWDRRADNHNISPQTETALLEYMSRNELNETLVRINQYDPWGEWKRLASNERISPGWRYTVGVYNGLKYTLLPGRVFGGDWYNPFTDTTHVYSDIAPLAISRTAYAKDIHSQRYPGTYAVTQEVPFINMIHETRATSEALVYIEQYGSDQERAESRRILAPDYGSSWGGQLASFLPFGTPLGRLAGAAVGHATNKFRNAGSRTTSETDNASGCDVIEIDWASVQFNP